MMHKEKLIVFIVIFVTVSSARFSSATASQFPSQEREAEAIYYNGSIITMQSEDHHANFVAVADGRIIAVEKEERLIKKWIGADTKLINLEGKTLMPGFVDPHSHFSMTALRYAQGFDISPPPFGTVSSIPQLLANLKDYITRNNIPAGQPITGTGYSDIEMAQRRHPTRFQLDSVSTVNPIVLTHFSFHMVVANSLALQLVNYTDASSSTAGGIIDAFPNGTITGVCREYAMNMLTNTFGRTFDKLTPNQIKQTANHYFSNGVTTVQDILFSEVQPTVYHQLADQLTIDVNGYAWINSPNLTSFQNIVQNMQTNRFKVKGGKFILDGSIQGFTALLTQPYWVPQDMYSDDLTDYVHDNTRSCSTEVCGQDNFPAPTLLRSLYKYFYFNNMDIITHCNGDQAADNMISAIEWAQKHSSQRSQTRVTMIHAQTVREDQLDKMTQLDIQPSFFPIHLYLWGDKHFQIFLGPDRANRMNPVGSAVRRGLKYTLHNDSPVVVMGIFNGINTFLKGIHAAVNRKTIKGRLLDDGTQKVSVYDALKGVTINAAWQAHEDDIKGSIAVGKLADLIILNQNPLTIEDIDNLKVQATIKNGQLVFGQYPDVTFNEFSAKQIQTQ